MIIHTLLYSFPDEMDGGEREEFLTGVATIMLEGGQAEKVESRPHLALPADAHAPIFVSTTVSQVVFPDLDALAATSALSSMHEFQARWRERHPYKVVWANHEPF